MQYGKLITVQDPTKPISSFYRQLVI